MLVDSFEISGGLSFINNVNAKIIMKILQSMVRIPEMNLLRPDDVTFDGMW